MSGQVRVGVGVGVGVGVINSITQQKQSKYEAMLALTKQNKRGCPSGLRSQT